MVPGRKPAALGLRALLAQGRRADLGRSRVDRAAKPDRATPTIEQAERFTVDIADALGVDDEFVLPAFEDPATGC